MSGEANPTLALQQALDPVGRLLALDELSTAIRACAGCSAARPSSLRVIGFGPLAAPLVLIGEAPGADEERRGEPFIGAAGQELDRWLDRAGIDRLEIRLMNALSCRPVEPGRRAGSERNRPPKSTERAACRRFALEQFRIIRPRAVVAIGDVAIEVFGRPAPAGVTAARVTGEPPPDAFVEIDAGVTARLFAIYHPSYRLRLANTDPGRGAEVERAAVSVLRAAAIAAGIVRAHG